MKQAKYIITVIPKILYRYTVRLYTKVIAPRVITACINDNNIFVVWLTLYFPPIYFRYIHDILYLYV